MQEILASLGRGIVKVLISFLAGGGVGVLVFGILARGKSALWASSEPPPELFIGVGSGALTAAFLLLVLFWRSFRRARLEGREELPQQG
jgi:hypothetical protein